MTKPAGAGQPKACEWCGAEFTPTRKTAKFCKPEHAVKARNARRESEDLPERTCDWCSEPFKPKRNNQRYCSRAHSLKAANSGRTDADGDRDDLRREVKMLKAALTDAESERAELEELYALVATMEGRQVSAPKWALPGKPRKGHRATPGLLITDTHFEEVVRPEEVDGLNAYNRQIAEQRLRRTFEGAVTLSRDYLSGVTYDGVVLLFGGDIFSGVIHEELRESNAATLMEAILYWLEPLKAGVETLLEEFGRVHVAATPGNHGRLTRKPRYKGRARDNVDWLVYRLLARDYRADDRVSFTVPEAMDTHLSIYDVDLLLTHGDQFRGGSGIAGALSPLSLGAHRKTRRETAAGRSYDVMVMGHFHQRIHLPGAGILSGGCLKGFDEFAYGMNMVPEPPSQELFLVTPENGLTFTTPVYSQDRKKEKW